MGYQGLQRCPGVLQRMREQNREEKDIKTKTIVIRYYGGNYAELYYGIGSGNNKFTLYFV